MALRAGDRLGSYEIVGAIGAGGMGEVYRGRDTRLDRAVAIKVLPDAVAQDPERLARFEREAKTLAALNHPHIAQIYGLEGQALAMEFVEGEDLSARIARGPIPMDDALAIAAEIARRSRPPTRSGSSIAI
jgi:serine/threonine protein kinase